MKIVVPLFALIFILSCWSTAVESQGWSSHHGISVIVHVNDAITGKPLDGAIVFGKISGIPNLHKKIRYTDKDGKCELSWVMKKGDVKMLVEKAFYFVKRLSLHFDEPGEYVVNVSLYPLPPEDEIPNATIEGQVTYVLLRMPVKGIVVEAYPIQAYPEFFNKVECFTPVGFATKTGENGKFILPVYCPGTVKLVNGSVVYDYSQPTRFIVETTLGLGIGTVNVYPGDTAHVNIILIAPPGLVM